MADAADLILTGARIHTQDPGRPVATALAIRNGIIVAVGDRSDVVALRGAHTRTIDGRGCVAVPGLVDAHCHPLWGARAMRDADLTGAKSLDAALALLDAAAREHPDQEWVVAHGLRREWWDGPIDGAVLEDATGGRPTFASFLDGHGAVAGPVALRRAGVDGPRRFADASEIVCDSDGVPTGELREPSAMEAVRSRIPPLSPERRRALYRAQLERMAAAGLVGAHVMDDSPPDLDDLVAMEAAAPLPVRLHLHLWLQPEMDDAAIGDAIDRAARRGTRWRAGAVKFFLDGVVDQGTAWLGAPDRHGHVTGPNWPDPERYAAVVARCLGAGLGCATHAIGDRAIATALDAYAVAGPHGPGGPPRRIEHAEFCDPADVARFARLGVVASVQPAHIAGAAVDGARWAERLDGARRGWGWPFADLAAHGAVLAFGSDWPVADPSPLAGMMWARQRAPGSTGAGYRAEQALDAAAALAGYTIGAAHAAGEPGGVVRPGARGDLTLLAGDPLACAAHEVPDIPILATILAGTLAFRSSDV